MVTVKNDDPGDDTQDLDVNGLLIGDTLCQRVNINHSNWSYWTPEKIAKEGFWCTWNKAWYSKHYFKCVLVDNMPYCFTESPVFKNITSPIGPQGETYYLAQDDHRRGSYNKPKERKYVQTGEGDHAGSGGHSGYGYGGPYNPYATGTTCYWKSNKEKLKEALELA